MAYNQIYRNIFSSSAPNALPLSRSFDIWLGEMFVDDDMLGKLIRKTFVCEETYENHFHAEISF
jgi:hypothetical protein